MSEGNLQIYSERKTIVGVLLGGPLAGGYYFWRSFRTVGMSTPAIVAPILAVLLFVLALGSTLIPAFDRIPNVIFWGLQTGLAYGAYRGYLAAAVEEHLTQGNAEFGWGNTITVAIVSGVLTLGIFTAVLFFSDSFNGQTFRYFGTLQHEIAYDEKNMSPGDVDKIGAALISAGFFDQEVKKTVDATKDGDRFILKMYCNESARDPEFIQLVRGLREDVQHSLPRNPIVIDMVIGTPDNRIARID